MCEIEKIEQIVVGKPLLLDGSFDAMTNAAVAFAKKAEELLGLPVEMIDERLSTAEAERGFSAMNAAMKHRKTKIDPLAAQRIAERWMEREKNQR